MKEAEGFIKEREELKEHINKVKPANENYLKGLEEYHIGFEGWKKHIRHLSINGMRLNQNLLKLVIYQKEKPRKVKKKKKKKIE